MFSFVLDFIFPKKCVGCKKYGSYLCDVCFSYIEIFEQYVCPMCLKYSITGETHPGCITPLSLDGLICGVVYKGVVKKMIFRLKYSPYVLDIGTTMGRLAVDAVSQNELFHRVLSSHPIVVEVPLSANKLKKRGYNQAEILGQFLADELDIYFLKEILVRIKPTNPQFKLDKKERQRNVLGAFEVNKKHRNMIKNKDILLVDDVSTSCATLKECAKILKRNGAKKVYGVTFAREI